MTDDKKTLDDLFNAPPDDEGRDNPDYDAAPSLDTRGGIAQLCLDEALTRKALNHLMRGGPLAVVAIVPSLAWVEAIKTELRRRTGWDKAIVGARKKGSLGDADEARQCADTLSRGGRVVGISNSATTLPASLLASADLTITIRPPSNRALRRLIRWVTGQHARGLPAGAATGLDLDTLCGAIRDGSNAADCVRRLAAASKAVSVVDTSLTDVPHVRDVHGMGAAGTWARKLVSDIEQWRASGSDPAAFARLDRNVVIGGPPGTGKTTLARSVAKSAGLPLVASSVSSLFSASSGYLDGVVKALDDVIGRAIAANGVLLLDELDALPSRQWMSDRDRAWWGTLVAHFLTSLDSAVSGGMGRVIVIGCTNHLDRLDPALIRPGRLRPIMVGLPTQADLAGIYRQHLAGDLPGVDLTPVARLSVGATGAEVADVVARARRHAEEARRPLDVTDLILMVSPEDDRSDETLMVAARHEIGHALSTELLLCGRVRTVSVLPDGVSGGRTDWFDTVGGTPTRAEIEAMVVSGLCGRAVDEMFGGANAGSGGAHASDLGTATRMVAALHASLGLGDRLVMRAPSAEVMDVLRYDATLAKVVDEHLGSLMARAREFCAHHRDLIDMLARHLVEVRVIDGEGFRRLIATATAPAPRKGGRRAH